MFFGFLRLGNGETLACVLVYIKYVKFKGDMSIETLEIITEQTALSSQF